MDHPFRTYANFTQFLTPPLLCWQFFTTFCWQFSLKFDPFPLQIADVLNGWSLMLNRINWNITYLLDERVRPRTAKMLHWFLVRLARIFVKDFTKFKDVTSALCQ